MRRLRRPSGGLWSNADFLKLWSGQSISEFGSQVSALAIPWLAAVGLHASPIDFSVLGMLGFLPFILFALPAGVWVDRLRRRPILIAGDASRAVLLAYIPIAWALGILDIWQLMALQFVIGIFTVFFDIAYQSYLPSLVEREQLVEGNSKLQTTVAAAGIAGPGVAGVLIGVLTAPYAIALDAASFVLSTAFMLPIRAPENLPERREGEPKPKMLPELKEGLLYVVRHRHLKWIAACTGASNLFGQIAFSIVILYMARTLHISSFWAGTVFAGLGVGSIAGALTTTRLQKAVGVGRAIWLTSVVFSVAALPARLPGACSARRSAPRGVRRHGLQHLSGEPASGDHPGAAAGPHERVDALDRLGDDPARDARGRDNRNRLQLAHRALGRRRRRALHVPAGAPLVRAFDPRDARAARGSGEPTRRDRGAGGRRYRSSRCPSYRRWKRGGAG
jgi:MFS family permease